MKKTNRKTARVIAALLIWFMLPAAPLYAKTKIMPDGGVFDPENYAVLYPDVTELLGTEESVLYTHYKDYGKAEGRLGTPDFDAVYYADMNPDLYAAFGYDEAALFRHYDTYGRQERRIACETFEDPYLELMRGISPVVIDWDEPAYNYLAIGNSITVHAKCRYWWNQAGMAPTSAENDFFHIVADYLQKTREEDVAAYAFNFVTWELWPQIRADVLGMLDGCLSEKLDLVTLQLGENVYNTSEYQEDFLQLILYIRERCPKAKIVVVDEFWNDERSRFRRQAAMEAGVEFADLSEIRGKREFQCGLGAIVYDGEGKPHIVTSGAVALHPGDNGMSYIAQQIIRLIG